MTAVSEAHQRVVAAAAARSGVANATQEASFLSSVGSRRSLCSSALLQSQVVAACILERLPVVAPPDPDWMVEHAQWSEELANRFRKRYTGEFAEIKKATDGTTEIPDYSKYKDEIEAAENGDWHSPWRRLDQRLFMLVKPSTGGGWAFPSAQHEEGETIRQTAERALESALDPPGPKVHFMGNGPAGHLQQQQLFFHRVQLIKGGIELRGRFADYVLAAKDELGQLIEDKDTLELLHKML